MRFTGWHQLRMAKGELQDTASQLEEAQQELETAQRRVLEQSHQKEELKQCSSGNGLSTSRVQQDLEQVTERLAAKKE